ncbi:MAG: hypothetical protein GY822_04895 [Deltaproteobacteria bacterium]|nr:hypothetical protein [Deltaproteobacteria bacterium]
MSWHRKMYPEYVSVDERRDSAEQELKRRTKAGQKLDPVPSVKGAPAKGPWGKAWNQNLKMYEEREKNRLARGRTYVRQGAVIDLVIERGHITAKVAGSSVYYIDLQIEPLDKELWANLQKRLSGRISTLLELIAGTFSKEIMSEVCQVDLGLFPGMDDVKMDCSCPDYAEPCKHIAAALYGIGARLDERPELLFTLRGVDPTELFNVKLSQNFANGRRRRLSEEVLSEVFGVDIDFATKATKQDVMPDIQESDEDDVLHGNAPEAGDIAGRNKVCAAKNEASSVENGMTVEQFRTFVATERQERLLKEHRNVYAQVRKHPGLNRRELMEVLHMTKTRIDAVVAWLGRAELIVYDRKVLMGYHVVPAAAATTFVDGLLDDDLKGLSARACAVLAAVALHPGTETAHVQERLGLQKSVVVHEMRKLKERSLISGTELLYARGQEE